MTSKKRAAARLLFLLVMGCEGKTDWRKKTGTRGDAEISYKIVISNIFVLSYVLTYQYELTLMVGKSYLATLGSV